MKVGQYKQTCKLCNKTIWMLIKERRAKYNILCRSLFFLRYNTMTVGSRQRYDFVYTTNMYLRFKATTLPQPSHSSFMLFYDSLMCQPYLITVASVNASVFVGCNIPFHLILMSINFSEIMLSTIDNTVTFFDVPVKSAPGVLMNNILQPSIDVRRGTKYKLLQSVNK